ncbi:MAG: hypothetical protein CVT63_06280 [Candidatus Anoxymicrobium japonicum]|uniref:Protein CR006 P-loop domain-containing protein n=1 Tax=Candidatus Anoxymicrobium japonicum TaxID=2013648 RepID=A0A2N3G5A9_9ACTN|nr:MAG: hypothetical protein CVT63_06280 [Candidatus Anoxymicrobium japonicum]
MLLRLIHLTFIQRWNARKGANFQRATVIYGENGRGKTSLSAVLRSVASGDPTPILERRTIDSAAMPSAALLFDLGKGNTTRTFNGTAWDSTVAQIEVFDTTFISENVYSGDVINPEHRRCLHKFVLGAQNVALAESVDKLDAAIRERNAEIAELEAPIGAKLGGMLTIDEFLALAPDAMIDEKIAAQEARVRVAEQSSQIASAETFAAAVLPQAAIAEALVVLAASLDTFAEEAEARVQHHIAARLNPEGKRWLEEGIGYLSDQSECPFCGLDTTSSSLVADYRVVFSDLYRQHSVRIATTKRQLSEALAESKLVAIEGVIASNGARRVFWKGHGIDAPSADHLGNLRKVWLKAVSTIGALFAKKDADVLAPVLPTDDQRADLDAVLSILERLREYNAQVAEIDKKVVALKQQAGEVNLQAVAGQLALLRLVKERYEPTVDAMCKDLINLRAEKKETESAKQTAKKDLDAATEQLFSKYQATLNKHLANCGCGYSITGTKTSYSGGKPRTEYQLLLNGKPIDLAQPKAKPHEPCFRNTLSDGDRSTLAFALFLARLELDHDLESKIVVLDDPMTSLDAHRRAYTCEQIADIAGKARQVIVLTHDATFAVDVWERLIKPKGALRLGVSGVDTVIEEWDISAATQSEYFRRCRLLADCVTGVHGLDQLAVASAMRPVVEANLRMRFPGAFAPDMWLGDFIEQIKGVPAAAMLAGMQPRLSDLIAINEYSKKYHHDGKGSPSKSQSTLAELQSYSRRTLEFIAGV